MISDLHIHSNYSHDSAMSIEAIIKAAKKIGLERIAVTDHNEIEGAIKAHRKEPGYAIPGIEISSLEGHVLCLGVKEKIEPYIPAAQVIEWAHDNGGIAIAAHPYDVFREAMGDLCKKLKFDAIEINGGCLVGNGYAVKAAKDSKKPLVGGSDAHIERQLGLVKTKTEGKDILEAIRKGKCSHIVHPSLTFKTDVLYNAILKSAARATKK